MKRFCLALIFLVLLLALNGPPAAAAVTAEDCAILDDPVQSAMLSYGLETRLNIECGLVPPAASSTDPGTLALAPTATDALVNNTAGDLGLSTTQSEVSLAVRPSDGRLCAGWNDSQHYANFPFNSFNGYAYSADGGATWSDPGALPPIPGQDNFGDPDVDFRLLDGKFYYVTLDSLGLAMHVSDDGCQSFSQHSQVHFGGGDDKELMAIDNWPESPYFGRMYVAWIDFGASDNIRLTSSDDSINWFPPVDLHPQDGRDVQGAWPTVAPNGDVYVAWLRWKPFPSGPIDVEIVRSTDGGLTFSPVSNPLTNGGNPRDANATSRCGRPALNGDIRLLPSPQLEVDANGVLHVVYPRDPDGFNNGDVMNIYYRRSTDQGSSWEPEIQINDDNGNNDQFYPSLAVTKLGGVAVSWYDRRNDPGNYEFQMYQAISQDGGLTWSPNVPLSDGPSEVPPLLPNFDPIVRNCYMGDYNESDADATHVYMVWSDNRNFRNGHPDPDVWFEKTVVPTNPCAIDLMNNTHNCEDGISFEVPPSGSQTVLKVNLDPAVSGFDGAVFDVFYGGPPSGWTVNIGDSQTNNGFGGDFATQSNDAEMEILGTDFAAYANDDVASPERAILKVWDLVEQGSSISFEVKNNFLGFGAGELRSHHLYALDGQADSEGPVNYDIFAGFNRSIYFSSRTGSGVTWVSIELHEAPTPPPPPPPPPPGGGGGKKKIKDAGGP